MEKVRMTKAEEKIKNHFMVEEYWWEDDGYGDRHCDCDKPSLWVALNKGYWNRTKEHHYVHVKSFTAALRSLKKDCEREVA